VKRVSCSALGPRRRLAAPQASELSRQLAASEARQAQVVAAMKGGWAAELRRQREGWAAGERAQRDKWLEAKTKVGGLGWTGGGARAQGGPLLL
jgi:hypothetical protein